MIGSFAVGIDKANHMWETAMFVLPKNLEFVYNALWIRGFLGTKQKNGGPYISPKNLEALCLAFSFGVLALVAGLNVDPSEKGVLRYESLVTRLLRYFWTAPA